MECWTLNSFAVESKLNRCSVIRMNIAIYIYWFTQSDTSFNVCVWVSEWVCMMGVAMRYVYVRSTMRNVYTWNMCHFQEIQLHESSTQSNKPNSPSNEKRDRSSFFVSIAFPLNAITMKFMKLSITINYTNVILIDRHEKNEPWTKNRVRCSRLWMNIKYSMRWIAWRIRIKTRCQQLFMHNNVDTRGTTKWWKKK